MTATPQPRFWDGFAPTEPIPRVRADPAAAARSADRSGDRSEDRGPFLPRLHLVLIGIAALIGLLSIGLPNIAPGVPLMSAPGSPVRMFFGVSEEMNLPTWFSVMLATAGGSAQLLLARLVGGTVGRAFLVTGVLLIAMGFDDFAALHERLNGLGGLGGDDAAYTWVIPGAVAGIGLLVAFGLLVLRLRGPARIYLFAGIATVMVAALGLETVSGFFDRPGTSGMPLQIITHVEEFLEALGYILVLRGALLMLRVSRRSGGLTLRVDDAAVGQA